MARNKESEESPQQLDLFLESRYLNIEQVAAILGVPKSFIYRRTARGHGDPIPHYRIGSHLRFKPDDIHEWIEGHRHEPETQSPAALVAALRQSTSRSTSTQKPARRRRRSS
jgi:excisionase family DNA binding protein